MVSGDRTGSSVSLADSNTFINWIYWANWIFIRAALTLDVHSRAGGNPGARSPFAESGTVTWIFTSRGKISEHERERGVWEGPEEGQEQ